MGKLILTLCVIFAFIWTVITTFIGMGVIEEKKSVKDRSWIFFLILFILFATTAIVLAMAGIFLYSVV